MRTKKYKKQLNTRETILLRELAKGHTYTEAARTAGYSEKCLAQSGFQVLQRLKEKIPDILDRKGLTNEAVIEKYLKPALEANETEFAKFEGKITDEREVVAWGPRLQALDMVWNLKGAYAPKAVVQNNTLIASFGEDERARVEQTMNKIRELAELE